MELAGPVIEVIVGDDLRQDLRDWGEHLRLVNVALAALKLVRDQVRRHLKLDVPEIFARSYPHLLAISLHPSLKAVVSACHFRRNLCLIVEK